MPQPLATALQSLTALARTWRSRGLGECYLVGGALRDLRLHCPFHDLDLAVLGDARAFAEAAAAALGTRVVLLDEPNGLYLLPLPDGLIDIVRCYDSLDADLARRDFTVNAFAFPLADLPPAGLAGISWDAVIDRFDGAADLERRCLRLITPQALDADPLRVVRAVRLAATLNFEIDPATLVALRARAPALARVAAERVGIELQRLFAAPQVDRGVRLLEDAGLLSVCFPVLDDGRGVEQRPLHLYEVFEHHLVTVDWLERLLAPECPAEPAAAALWRALWESAGRSPGRSAALRAHLRDHVVPLRLAALLHDVGKPATRSLDAHGNTHFFGHADLGAGQAAVVLQRWRLPNALIDRVCLLIREHLRPGQVAAPGRPPTERALFRFHRAIGDAVPDLCFLFLADSLATVGPQRLLPRWPAYVAHVARLIDWQPSAEAAALAQMLDGHAVMTATGLPPGPTVGRVLAAVAEAVAAGEVRDRAAALALAAKLAADPQFLGAAPRG